MLSGSSLAFLNALRAEGPVAEALCRELGADLCVLIAREGGAASIVECAPAEALERLDGRVDEPLAGDPAGRWTTVTRALADSESSRAIAAEGCMCALEVTIGEGADAARLLLASESPDWHLLDCAAEIELLAQGLGPLIRDRAVSAQRTFHRQLQQAQKMESLGSMAGQVAHDFNNLLTTILGYTSLIKGSPTISARDRESLELVEEAAHRAADLSGRLLAFARGGLVRFGPLDLRAVVWDSMKLADPAIHDTITLHVQLPDEAVPVEGDSGQLQQAILNILLNAVDAMPEGGTIEVGLHRDEQQAHLTVADTGPGMDESTRERIYEPFYTTKPVGSGTGLGLAITYGIVQGHEGQIGLQTAPGKGSRFTISLPLVATPAPRGPLADPNVDGDLVLVVDDDDMVRRATTATVAHLGYNVVEAHSGRLAIELVRARPERFSVVLLDLVMPELTGAETFRELQKIRADLPVIVCTGYAADNHIDAAMKRKIAGLVQKPFDPERLRKAIAGVVGSEG